MPIERLRNEGELKRFIEQVVGNLPVLIRQLQGSVRRGSGSPEGVVDAPKAAVYEREDGAPGTLLYVKSTAAGTLTGWVAFA